MKLGILGGTFDPVHHGHLRLALEAKRSLGLDKVVLETANQSPLKTPSATSPELRLRMVQCATAMEPGLEAGSKEISRPPPSYTVETVQAYLPAEIHVILGADALASLPQWKDPARLMSMCRLAVAVRPGHDIEAAILTLPHSWKKQIDVFQIPLLEISSTDIRARVASSQSVRYLTPDCVIQKIDEQRLYK